MKKINPEKNMTVVYPSVDMPAKCVMEGVTVDVVPDDMDTPIVVRVEKDADPVACLKEIEKLGTQVAAFVVSSNEGLNDRSFAGNVLLVRAEDDLSGHKAFQCFCDLFYIPTQSFYGGSKDTMSLFQKEFSTTCYFKFVTAGTDPASMEQMKASIVMVYRKDIMFAVSEWRKLSEQFNNAAILPFDYGYCRPVGAAEDWEGMGFFSPLPNW